MSRDDLGSHEEHADQLRSRVASTGLTEQVLRLGALARGAGGPAIPEPYDALARQVGEDSSRVTNAQVLTVRDSAGSEKAAFEIVLTAAIGAGLRRWDAAENAIKEAGDAAP
jgi:hypothetical protein